MVDVVTHAPVERPRQDVFMRRLLRVDHAPPATADQARSALRNSVLAAAVRCTLVYIVLPFVLPAVGFATRVGPAIGLAIGAIAIACIIASMRRFWRAEHRARWAYTAFGGGVMLVLLVFMTIDAVNLITGN